MVLRWGPGPVFVFESIIAARRWQPYALRAVFVLVLLIALFSNWTSAGLGNGNLSNINGADVRNMLSRLGEYFFASLAIIQIALVLLVAPAMTAGSLCLDRARGTLQHVFVTDLSNREIVLGKLAARLAPVLALLASALPVVALVGLLGGIEPVAVVWLFLISLAISFVGASLALAVSARVGKAHEVLMVVYTFWVIWLLVVPIWLGFVRGAPNAVPWWVLSLNPFILAFVPTTNRIIPGVGWESLGLYLAVSAVLSLCAILFAIRVLRGELRPEKRHERRERALGWMRARFFSWWPSPDLDRNPVLWREWHRNRPSKTASRVWLLLIVCTIVGTGCGVYESVVFGITMNGPNLTILVNALSVTIGLMFLSVTAPTALSEERVRGSLDVLMSTPLSTRSIVLGKWWGTFRIVPLLAILPALGTFLFAIGAPDRSTWSGRPWANMPQIHELTTSDRLAAFGLPVAWILVHGMMITSVGLALGTWIKRPGLAMSLSAAYYVFALIGWPMFTEGVVLPAIQRYTFNQNYFDTQWLGSGLASFSPFGGQVILAESILRPWMQHRAWLWDVQIGLIALTFVSSIGLLFLVIRTFDRAMGRVEERPAFDQAVLDGARRTSREERENRVPALDP